MGGDRQNSHTFGAEPPATLTWMQSFWEITKPFGYLRWRNPHLLYKPYGKGKTGVIKLPPMGSWLTERQMDEWGVKSPPNERYLASMFPFSEGDWVPRDPFWVELS